MSPPDASAGLRIGFIALSVLMALGFLITVWWATRGGSRRPLVVTAIGVLGMMGVSAGLAATGFLARFEPPPPNAVPVFVGGVMLVILFARSSLGGRLATELPVWFIVGFQAFRIPVELLIHQAIGEGVAPPQMGWNGMNFDIISGITAVAVGSMAWRGNAGKGVLFAWNLVGLGLLMNVVIVAILSMPTAFQRLSPDNTWVAFFPFVWLPMVLVALALLGHLILFRRLSAAEAPPDPEPAPA